jgi:D-alanine-D-alanine ligase
MHKDLIPPEKADAKALESADWRTEYEVTRALKKLGHNVTTLGVLNDLEPVRKALEEIKPNIVFNLLEEFDSNPTWDQHVVSYLELKKVPYTGCNPRGLTLARDKALSKKILSFHRIPFPKFQVFPKNQRVKLRKGLQYPVIVKSLVEEASMGISQASVVHNDSALEERVSFIHQSLDTDAIVEQFIEGREFYVGVIGNNRLKTFPVWELNLNDLPDSANRIATEKAKWNDKYRKKYKI